MKIQSLLSLVAILASQPGAKASPTDTKQEAEPFKPFEGAIVSWNIRFDNARHCVDNELPWEIRRHDVLRHLKEKVDTDVPTLICLQEALGHQADFLAAKVGKDWNYIGESSEGNRGRGERSAIIYDRTKFKVLEGHMRWFSSDPELPGSLGWGEALPRTLTYTYFQHIQSGHKIALTCTHLSNSSEKSRKKSMDYLIKNIKNDGKVHFLAGDLNFQPTDALHEALTDSMLDIGGMARFGPDRETTYIGWRDKKKDEKIVDYIAASVEAAKHYTWEEFNVTSVFLDKAEDPKFRNRTASDHRPLYLRFKAKAPFDTWP